MNLSGDSESREVVKNSASKVKEETDFSSPAGSRLCAGVQIVTGIPYSSRQIGAIDSVGARHNEEGAEDEIEPDRRISTMKTCEFSSEEESVSEDTSTSSNEDFRHISMAKKYFERRRSILHLEIQSRLMMDLMISLSIPGALMAFILNRLTGC